MNKDNKPIQNANILIVDDDATICILMEEALSKYSHCITIVNNGRDALIEIKNNRPDLILLDVTMPEMDGFKVCAEIRKLYGETSISIVMVTALEDASSIEKSYNLGATAFISKPINWNTFPYRIQYLLKARNAIFKIQQHQLHLEYMEHVTRIMTQNKDKETIMQETMYAMLDIFSADRISLLKPDISQEECFIVDCETAIECADSLDYLNVSVIDTLEENIIERATRSEYPIVTYYDLNNPPSVANSSLTQQVICSLKVKHTQCWHLVIQQNTNQQRWSALEIETFYKISLRLTNILSRHLLTEDLSLSKSLLKQTQKIARLGNWNWNATNRQLTWSDEIYLIYELDKSSYTPECDNFFEVRFEEDENRLSLLNDLKNNVIQSFQFNHRIKTPDKTIKWVYEHCVGAYGDNNKLLEINGIVQDITESYLKKEQQVHNSKMESIGQLTSGIAHDFGNLMTVAKGNIELLEEELLKFKDTDNEINELLTDTQSVVQDGVELTKQLLSFSRKKSIAPIYVNIRDTLNKFKTLFIKTLGDNIKLSLEIHNNVHDILVDPSQFENALLNIIINAKNAMPNGGSLHIIAQKMTAPLSFINACNVDSKLGTDYISVEITDTGVGMDEDTQSRAIEPFFTTRNNQGTGLGLSMAYAFVKQSDGDLTIFSKIGEGTTISLQFPIFGGTASDEEKVKETKSLDNIEATILIVEDRYTLKQFAVRCLNYSGITILQADNAETAKELLNSNNVDLLFTDIVMPGKMDGHQLARWANKEHQGLKILLTTAVESRDLYKEKISKSKEKDFDEKHKFKMLHKPYNKVDLVENVANLLQSNTN